MMLTAILHLLYSLPDAGSFRDLREPARQPEKPRPWLAALVVSSCVVTSAALLAAWIGGAI